jgi:hypothetical protein
MDSSLFDFKITLRSAPINAAHIAFAGVAIRRLNTAK